MAKRPGWVSPIYGTVYEFKDERLAGYGDPPSDPEFQKDNPGAGRFLLEQTLVEGTIGKPTEVS